MCDTTISLKVPSNLWVKLSNPQRKIGVESALVEVVSPEILLNNLRTSGDGLFMLDRGWVSWVGLEENVFVDADPIQFLVCEDKAFNVYYMKWGQHVIFIFRQGTSNYYSLPLDIPVLNKFIAGGCGHVN